MKEIFKFFIKAKTNHPLIFWMIVFIMTIIVFYVIWKFIKNKRRNTSLDKHAKSSTTSAGNKIIKQKQQNNKEKYILKEPPVKPSIYSADKKNIEIIEPKPVSANKKLKNRNPKLDPLCKEKPSKNCEIKRREALNLSGLDDEDEEKFERKYAEEMSEEIPHSSDISFDKFTSKEAHLPIGIYVDEFTGREIPYPSGTYIDKDTGKEVSYLIRTCVNPNTGEEYYGLYGTCIDEKTGEETSYPIGAYVYKDTNEKDSYSTIIATYVHKDTGKEVTYSIRTCVYPDTGEEYYGLYGTYIDENTGEEILYSYGKYVDENEDTGEDPEIEKTKPKNKTDFVNYVISKDETINSYPAFLFPQKGTVVRSYRLGKTKRRGFKEQSFQSSNEQYFGKDFKVLGNARLNTGNDIRPFEPDIAIVDDGSSNLRIDIEIDEPYAGITRQPTHCKGEDTGRDIYFVDRGWIVIRFSEHQVHLYEKSCLLYIANIIKLALPQYNIPTSLKAVPSLPMESQWDIIQAQKWEEMNFREKYLGHTFQFIEEEPETIERNFNEQELREERLVKPTHFDTVENRNYTAFNIKNRHSRDSRIKFYPKPHIYEIDGVPVPSASTIISKFFPEFDIQYWADKKAPGLGMHPEDLKEMWRKKGEEAASKGTFLHEQIEKYYLGEPYKAVDEFSLFENFNKNHTHLNPYRSEWRIYDEYYGVAGTIDLISKNNGGYEIYDWKRSEKVVNSFNGELIKNNPLRQGVGQLSDIDDTSYNRYCLQQSLYKFILEKNYNLKISKMYLVVLHPKYDKYYKVKVPYLKDRIEYILRTL